LSFPIGLFCLIWRESAVVFMRPQCAAITDHIVRDRLLRRGKAWTSDFRHPFCFQTPEDSGYQTVADPPSCKRALAAAAHPKHPTQALHRIALFKSLDYRELLRESELHLFVVPWPDPSARSLRTQYSMVDFPTPMASQAALFV